MKELICPNCNKPFSVNDADYAMLLSQVKNREFQSELNQRIEELHAQWLSEHQVAELKAAQTHQQELTNKEHALQAKEAMILQLQEKLNSIEQTKQAELNLALSEQKSQLSQRLNEQELTISQLRSKQESLLNEAQLKEQGLKADYENRLKVAQEQIDYYKDMKIRLSTKMVGESLEQHCSSQFNQLLRPLIPNAYFEKDNDASGGSKGDFIFRDYANGEEYVSIMFEMKNEMDTTANKHKNEDFFAKLDADRQKKNCEFAVLVSLLEPDSELYNGGIVDVSYKYDKMYVIRPQFFIPLISLLMQTSKKSIEYKHQLAIERSKNVDVTNFENKLDAAKNGFNKNVDLAHKQYEKAIDAIDKAIRDLLDVKEQLSKSGNHLRIANNQLQELTIRKLTWGNPTMKELFDEAAANQSENIASEPTDSPADETDTNE